MIDAVWGLLRQDGRLAGLLQSRMSRCPAHRAEQFECHSLKVVVPVHAVKSSLPLSSISRSVCPIRMGRVITAQLLEQCLVAVDDAHATFDLGFGREALAALAHRLEKMLRV